MKSIELRLVSELMKNSRRSDRELAKVLRTSQPTVSRLIKRFEKDRCICEYTAIPDFGKLGLEVMAITLVKCDKGLSEEEYAKVLKAGVELDKKQGLPVVMVVKGIGSNYDMLVVSVHRDYSDYREMVASLRQMPCMIDATVQSFMVDLANSDRYRPLTFSALAEYLSRLAIDVKK